MTIFITALLFLGFMSSAFISADFVLVILIARSFIISGKSNYYLAFFFGILLSLLKDYPLGSFAIFYLFAVFLVGLFRKTQFLSSPVMFLPVAGLLLLVNRISFQLLLGVSIDWRELVIEVIFFIPAYFTVRFWEERFVPGKEIKLKMGK